MMGASSKSRFRESRALMDTVVTIDVTSGEDEATPVIERAFKWFEHVERICSRFDPGSDVVRLCRSVGKPVQVSPVLFQAVSFALALGERSGGAFDVRLGALMERRGFDCNYRGGRRQRFAAAGAGLVGDVVLDAGNRTVTLTRPTLLDLGAVAKGLAIDLAARELSGFDRFAINAGGDIYVAGRGDTGGWRIGVQDPERGDAVTEILQVADAAVCTSGSYQRRAERYDDHHILDPRTQASPGGVQSATVVAPNSMLADGLSTALFVLGAEDGLALVEEFGAEGMLIGPEFGRKATAGFDAMVLKVRG